MNTLISSLLRTALVLLLAIPVASQAEPKSAETKEAKSAKKENAGRVAPEGRKKREEHKRREEHKHGHHRKKEEQPALSGEVRTFLGVATSPVAPSLREHMELDEGFGIQVHQTLPDSPAVKAGLKKHDILVKFEDQLLISPEHLSLLVRTKEGGDKVDLTLIRKGSEKVVTVTLSEKEESFWPRSDHRIMPGHRGHHFDYRDLKSFDDYESWQKQMKEQQDKIRRGWFYEKQPTPGEKAAKSEMPQLDGKPPAVSVQPGFPVTVLGTKGVIKIDNQEGEVTITEKDGKHEIEIRNADDELIHEGEFDPEAGTEALPREAQDHLEKMKLDNLEVLAPRSESEVKKTGTSAKEAPAEELL